MNSRAKAAAEWINRDTVHMLRFYPNSLTDWIRSVPYIDENHSNSIVTDDELIIEARRLGMPVQDCPCLEDLPGEVQLCDPPCRQPDEETNNLTKAEEPQQ